jgi:predicted nucleic acid-binding protein
LIEYKVIVFGKKVEYTHKKQAHDDMFIWCAIEGKANALVSGVEHLLKLKESPVPILSASGFLKMIERKE